MKCIRLCQELETPEDKVNEIPIFDAHENIEEVIQIYLIKLDFIQKSCFVMMMSVQNCSPNTMYKITYF